MDWDLALSAVGPMLPVVGIDGSPASGGVGLRTVRRRLSTISGLYAFLTVRGDVARNTTGDLKAALGRVTATMFVMPIDEDMFFPVRDCAQEQAMVPGSELRVLHSIAGHFGLFGFEPSYLEEVDQHLRELLETPV